MNASSSSFFFLHSRSFCVHILTIFAVGMLARMQNKSSRAFTAKGGVGGGVGGGRFPQINIT